ncbi:hypothetical protein [Ilumatobacter sp.]|uniref:hypothetical protein n=1 Tax=Ilumatobacter sp. TaxID=1967498 RepID=UPI003B523BA4
MSNFDVGAAAEQITDLDDVEVVGPHRVGGTESTESMSQVSDVATDISDHRSPGHALHPALIPRRRRYRHVDHGTSLDPRHQHVEHGKVVLSSVIHRNR